MDIFDFINIQADEPCLQNDELYIPEGKWFRLDSIQYSPLDVKTLKKQYGNTFSITVPCIGNLLVKVGVSAKERSFTWCGEKTIIARKPKLDSLLIDLTSVYSGTLEITLYGIEECLIFNNNRKISFPKAIQQEKILYNFISPSYNLCTEEPLYYKFSGQRSYYSFEDSSLHMKKDSSIDMLTYFNSFSAVKWKKYTNVNQLSLYIDITGEVYADIIHLDTYGKIVLSSWKIQTTERSTFELPLEDYPDTGIIGLVIKATKDSIIYGGGYLTEASQTQNVHLGIGITTFRRENAVKNSVSRLGKAIAAHPLYHDAIDITVVDNGKTLSQADVPSASLIPNKNLGGTGGFMRSLIHYQTQKRYTHCLFMDDDASCEAGSIFRTMSFIRHAKEPSLAVSGGMLFENIQFLQWENGAWFDGGCHSLNRDLDLRDARNLLRNEQESDKQIYGAWWFFFFPIAQVKQYSFPFFVRGDDIDFSYSNDFTIATLNGVSCWQQDFKTKENALTAYLFLRSHVMHHLTIPQLNSSFKTLWKILWGHFSTYNNSYLYGSAACVNLAIKHILEGPSFWEKNMEPDNIFKQIKELSKNETPLPLINDIKDSAIHADKNITTPYFPVLLRKLTCYGHLIPNCLFKKTPQNMLYKWQMPNPKRCFLRKKIIVIDNINSKYQRLQIDKIKYWKNTFYFFYLIMKLYAKKETLYKNNSLRQIWEKIY